jgi:hypothetical protein
LISCDCCGYGLLEVKCPIGLAGKDPNVVSVPYLEDVDGSRAVKSSRKYYTQMQMQMALSKRQWCDFLVFSDSCQHLERIKFDAIFWQNAETCLSHCYYTYIVPSTMLCG